MIVFDLKCDGGHVFEAWFKNSAVYKTQADQGHIQCPYCGSSRVSKSLMSPHIASGAEETPPSGANRDPEPSGYESRILKPEEQGDDMISASAHMPENGEVSAEDVKRALQHMHETMQKYHNHVRRVCDYVGEDFAREARAMHDGEIEMRGIYGEATVEETEELLDDGIMVLPVPGLGKLDS